ncbi:hydantoinase B/oxoprolinase family protein [Streptomyces sp. NPDC056049]
METLGGAATTEVAPGDVLVLRTPGGGGYGTPPPEPGRDTGPTAP